MPAQTVLRTIPLRRHEFSDPFVYSNILHPPLFFFFDFSTKTKPAKLSNVSQHNRLNKATESNLIKLNRIKPIESDFIIYFRQTDLWEGL